MRRWRAIEPTVFFGDSFRSCMWGLERPLTKSITSRTTSFILRGAVASQLDARFALRAAPTATRLWLTVKERYEASEALHAEKESGNVQEDMSYGDLLTWLRQWRG